MSRINDLERDYVDILSDEFTRRRAAAFSHPHYHTLKYYPHRVGLKGNLTLGTREWLNENTVGRWSKDYTTAPYNISFEDRGDAVKFKLTFGGTIACRAHRP